MSPPQRVLKFSRSDDESSYVLLNVLSRGSKSLDVKLQATEGEAEYGQALKQSKIDSLRVKNCPVSESEWQEILEGLLQQEFQPDIQATATVSDGSSISIVVRKSIQGITQRLGAITLPIIEDGELNVLDWCATAVDAAAENKKAAKQAQEKAQQLETEIDDLKEQLKELIKTKDEDETALLLKFRDLLNEKKIKIREQQKIIASNPQDHGSTSPKPEQTELPERSRKADKSRSSKRKQPPPPVEESSENEFEPMEVDGVKTEPEDSDKQTDSDGTASTASEDEDEDAKTVDSTSGANEASSAQPPKPALKKPQGAPPPKRDLPFTKQKAKAAQATANTAAGSETESDDEL